MESTARIAAPPAPITAALPFEKAKRTRSADPPFESNCSATTLSPHTAARKHAEERPADRRQQIKPEAFTLRDMTGEESAGVLFTMISPNIITVRRIRKTALLRRRSIRDISRDYFGTEHVRFLVVESILFAIMAAVAIWPIVNAAEAIKLYLL